MFALVCSSYNKHVGGVCVRVGVACVTEGHRK